LITGATGGIGGALAEAYAAPGTTLVLHGRDPERLAAVTVQCRARGAEVWTHTLDVRDRPALKAWLVETAERLPIDLAFVNAGVNNHVERESGAESWSDVERLIEVNVLAAFATVDALLPATQKTRIRVAFPYLRLYLGYEPLSRVDIPRMTKACYEQDIPPGLEVRACIGFETIKYIDG